jgi:hypothetical protein
VRDDDKTDREVMEAMLLSDHERRLSISDNNKSTAYRLKGRTKPTKEQKAFLRGISRNRGS